MQSSRRVRSIVTAAVVVVILPAGPPPASATTPEPHRGPVILEVECPHGEGLGAAARPGPAVAVARRFLLSERGRTRQRMAASADRWLRHRVISAGPAGLRVLFPLIRPGGPSWRFRMRPPRWLDARSGVLGPFLNARMKLLAAGVQVYSCPRRLIRRLIRATWWIQVMLPGCRCDPDRLLDLLVVRRNGRYRVFGLN